MQIKIPDKITSELYGYNQIVRFIKNASDLKNSTIELDFTLVSFLEANLCAVLGVCFEILEKNGNQIKLVNLQPNVEKIMRKNKFLLKYGFEPLEDSYKTTIAYQKFTPNNDEGFNTYILKKLLSLPEFPKHTPKLRKEILRNIFEIFENARTHGSCEYIHTCGQFFPKKPDKPLHFTIVDKGINIQQNVNDFLNENLKADEAIKWAMQKGHTTKKGDTSGGLGLNVIFEFIKLNNGKIQVISSDGFYEFNRGQERVSLLSNAFSGTIVNLRFNLSDSNSYYLKGEQLDEDIIF
ncbi:MAG: hypothetical protein WEA99_08035 [Brumimicrobium sp.]